MTQYLQTIADIINKLKTTDPNWKVGKVVYLFESKSVLYRTKKINVRLQTTFSPGLCEKFLSVNSAYDKMCRRAEFLTTEGYTVVWSNTKDSFNAIK
jgi:hypothetical protein